MSKVLVAPSVLSADFGFIAQELDKLHTADMIHLDVMDGHYVPNLSFGYPLIKRIRQLTSKPLDVHLMVTNPAEYIDRLAEIGVQWISFHQESEYHSHRLLHKIRGLGIKAGLALNPATPLNTLDSILPDLDYVLLMSVNPGFSAQKFIPGVLEKVRKLRAMIDAAGLDTLIEVDGGVNSENAPSLISAGADILVSASYIFNSEDYSKAIENLRG